MSWLLIYIWCGAFVGITKIYLWQLFHTKMVKVLNPSSFGMVSFHLMHYTNKICTSHFPPATRMRWISQEVRNSCCQKDYMKTNTTRKITAILKKVCCVIQIYLLLMSYCLHYLLVAIRCSYKHILLQGIHTCEMQTIHNIHNFQ